MLCYIIWLFQSGLPPAGACWVAGGTEQGKAKLGAPERWTACSDHSGGHRKQSHHEDATSCWGG